MAFTDTIVASIEAKLQELKEAVTPTPAPAVVVEPTPAVVEPTPAPAVVVEPTPAVVEPTPAPEKHSNPIIQMAIDQAKERLARETAK